MLAADRWQFDHTADHPAGYQLGGWGPRPHLDRRFHLDQRLAKASLQDLAEVFTRVTSFASMRKDRRFELGRLSAGQFDLTRLTDVVVDLEVGLSHLDKSEVVVDDEAVLSGRHVDRAFVRAMLSYFVACYVFCWCIQFYLQHRTDAMDVAATLTGVSAWKIAQISSSIVRKAFDQAFPPDAD